MIAGCTGSWAIISGVVGDPAPGQAQSWGFVRSDVPPEALRFREVELGEDGSQDSRLSLPPPAGGAPARLWSRRKQKGRQASGRQAMGAWVAVLLLAQLLGRAELEIEGELRSELPADLRVMGVGWGAWRQKGAHLLTSPQTRWIRICCYQVRRPGRALAFIGHLGQSAHGASSFHLSSHPRFPELIIAHM